VYSITVYIERCYCLLYCLLLRIYRVIASFSFLSFILSFSLSLSLLSSKSIHHRVLYYHGPRHGHGLILLGALLIHLPGAEIVWGVLEILQGSVVHGSSRLVKGLISAICLAVFVTLGTLIH
jgi:uncharacterized membrane protein YjjP (DUF1212 family)